MSARSKSAAESLIAKALKHPLRVEIWAILDNRTASPAEVACELNQPIGNVAYHVKELLRFECIELVKIRPVRGAVEHFYRAVRRPYFSDEDWATLPRAGRQGVSGAVVGMIGADVVASFDAGAFDARPDRHLSRTPLFLDEQGWEAMVEMLNMTVERALDLQAEAAERMAKSKEQGVSARMALFGFQMGGEEPDAMARP